MCKGSWDKYGWNNYASILFGDEKFYKMEK